MGRIVLLMGIVAAISMLVVYAVSRSSATEPQMRIPPILQDEKVWARTEPVMFLQ